MSNTRSAQLSFDDLGQPLVSTTFVVVDLETTGGSAATDAITEVGAVKVRGGETLGTFATLVNPGRAIPPTITLLTGITESMVAKAPRIESVLPSLLEFIGDAVVVGHNVRFDVGFLQAALHRAGHPPLTGPTVDTVALARRLVRDQVPNCKLGTLAEHLRLSHTPNHRALDDAITTAELLHLLIDRAGRLGVTGLDDLLVLPTMAGHPQADKLRLTARLPRRPGVYLFRTASGDVLYVGKATDLRTRVRSYFSTDDRRKVGPLLKRTERIDHKVCSSVLEAEVLEGRLIRHLDPPYNQTGTRWRASPYLRVRTAGASSGLTVTRDLPDDGTEDGTVLLGPFSSSTMVRTAVQGLESVLPLRRRPKGGAVTTSSPEVARAAAATALTALTAQPELALVPLGERMAELARLERFEDAAGVRDQMVAFTGLLRATRRREQLLRAEQLVLTLPDGGRAEMRRGVLWRTWTVADGGLVDVPHEVEMRPELPGAEGALPRELADELATASAWLDRHGDQLRVEHVDGTWASDLPALPDYRSARSARYDAERARADDRPARLSRRRAG
ncbi:MAG: exonuclease domain-containing protein [Actinomycetes bacterium]